MGLLGAFAVLFSLCLPLPAAAQPPGAQPPSPAADSPERVPDVPETVEVDPTVDDAEIAARISRILQATGWFRDSRVRVDEGVVVLEGQSGEERYKEWAGNLARNTEEVVAVVNRIEVAGRPLLDLTPAWQELQRIGRNAVQSLPLILAGLMLLLITWLVTRWSVPVARRIAARRIPNHLLQQVAARAAVIPIFVLGVYLALRICGLTQIAVTVLGGTGLLGLVLGIAFRDITENFLASILISMQRPFEMGDLIRIAGHLGVVQSVTTRGTVLMALDGNHIQIPNATVYKGMIENLTANPNVRMEFLVGIGYENSSSEAQDLLMNVLKDHPAVLEEPEPMVLVDQLANATVNLRVYFWTNGHEYNGLKVRSSVIRLTKRALETAGISMPDPDREIVFAGPLAVDLRQPSAEQARAPEPPRKEHPPTTSAESAAVETSSEGGLASEREELQQQARQSRSPERGTNLLVDSPPAEDAG